MKSLPVSIAACISVAGCVPVDSRVSHTPQIGKPELYGVWEIVSCSAINPDSGHPESTLNYKYCFNSGAAYPRLAPDSASDSADGGGEYHMVGDDILVIRTGVPGGIEAYAIRLSGDRLILSDSRFRTTMRRIADSWEGKAPVIKPRDIPIIR